MRRAERRPRGGQTNAAYQTYRYQKHNTPTERVKDFLSDAQAVAEQWVDVSERLLSCIYHALWLPVYGAGPELREVLANADFELGSEHFPTPQHWAVCQALAAHAERRAVPTRASLRRFASTVAYISNTANPNDDLIRRLPYTESTAAGIASYAAWLIQFGRRRALAETLRCAYLDLLDRFIEPDEVAAGLVDTITLWESDGANAPKPPRLTRHDLTRLTRPQLEGRVVA